MYLHKEGHKIVGITTVITLIIVIAVVFWADTLKLWSLLIIVPAIILWVLIVRFFRMPVRQMNLNEDVVLCPADGVIKAIEEVYVDEYLNEKRIQVSVFMSPNNVHVNRYPISGKVVYTHYWEGKYLVAWHPKSSTENERSAVVVENPKHGTVLFRQIAGAVARRIVCYAKVGDEAPQGGEFGFIKFGSRVDVFLPLNAKITVKLNEKVRGGITHLAKFQ